MKTCNKCGVAKDLTNYVPDRRNKDGLQGICNSCRKFAKHTARVKRLLAGTPVLVSNKTCNKCGQHKQAIDFYKDSGISDGLSTICKYCKNETVAIWKDKHRGHYNASMRRWRAENKDAAKSSDLTRCYGITLEDYRRMLEDQGGVCSLCKKPQKGIRPLVVDHCHDTGKVRGLLCYGCNRLVVTLDNHPLHDQILDYLKKPTKA